MVKTIQIIANIVLGIGIGWAIGSGLGRVFIKYAKIGWPNRFKL